MSSPTSPKVNGTEDASSAVTAGADADHREGSWSPPDPNQVGSGWNEGLTGSPRFEDDTASLAAAYDRLVERTRAANAHAVDGQGGINDDLTHVDDDWEVQMHLAPAYMEFILKLRDCTHEGCSRRTPCTECGQHVGASIPSGLWHFLSDRRIEAHLTQYLRVRSLLLPPQSVLPPYVTAPGHIFGGEGWSTHDQAMSDSWAAMGERLVREREILHGWPQDGPAGAGPASVPSSPATQEDSSPPTSSAASDPERRRIFQELQRDIEVFERSIACFAELSRPIEYLYDFGVVGALSRVGGARRPRVQADGGEDDYDSDLPDLKDISESSSEASEHGEPGTVA